MSKKEAKREEPKKPAGGKQGGPTEADRMKYGRNESRAKNQER